MTLLKATPRVQSRTRLDAPFSKEELAHFEAICGQRTPPSHYPLSEDIIHNAVVYSGDSLRRSLPDAREEIMAEVHRCLATGPGVFIIRDFSSTDVVKRSNPVLQSIIEKEREHSKGDHFAAPGNNDRIWNAFQKHALADPKSFVEYYANELLDVVSEAWLGPGYQVTAQVNVVRPGGKGQKPHRDYHLGFQSEQTAARFPIASQVASAMLTLQGAVAHTAMPLESGPTQLLPFSQQFEHGYLAYRHPEFVEIFNKHMVQTELNVGDAIFFNPALFHAAGSNHTSDVHRMGNLLQISACWSKPMESVNHDAILQATWNDLRSFAEHAGIHSAQMQALLKAVCDGYSFPTNLDRDPPPADSHCPETQLDRVQAGVSAGWSETDLGRELVALKAKRLA